MVRSHGGYGDVGPYTLSGTASPDELVVFGTAGHDDILVRDRADLPAGFEVLVNGRLAQLGSWANLVNLTLLGLGGNDRIRVESATYARHPVRITLKGGDGNDELRGGAGNDTLVGRAGQDRLYGQAGNDTLSGDAGNDLLRGDEGDDLLAGGEGNDDLAGGEGNDLLRGDGGRDTIRSGVGNDAVLGGLSEDALLGEGVNSTLSHDTFRIADINQDGRPDGIAVAYDNPRGMVLTSFLSGPGEAFRAVQQVLGDGEMNLPLVGDVNADGRSDLVFHYYHLVLGLVVRTKFSNGDGTWAGAQQVLGDGHLDFPLVADANGDGRADLIFTYDHPTLGRVRRVKLANGDGSWTALPEVVDPDR